MSHAKICFFGAVQGTDSNNVKISFQRRKAVALLSYLLIDSKQHSRNHLAGFFWPDIEEKDARNNLRVVLSRLSKSLSTESHSLLITDRQNIQINPDFTVWLDVREFDVYIDQTKEHEHDQRAYCTTCNTTLEKAVKLYQGIFLDNFQLENCEEFEEWLSLVRERYRKKASAAFADLSLFYEHAEEYRKAEKYTRETLQVDPLSEDANRRIMRLLCYKNERNAALEHFSVYQKYLYVELGVEPEDATVSLFHKIQAGGMASSPTIDVFPSQSQIQIKNNLPLEMTSFVGREKELTQLDGYLDKYRLITLIGIGGTGKTRLALELAKKRLQKSFSKVSTHNHASNDFSDGIFFVSLELVTRLEDLPLELAKTVSMDIQPVMDLEVQILNYLQDKSMLIVFDNFEHLTQGNEFVGSLLKAAPALQIVTTSRQKLAISPEAVYRVSGLDYSTTNQPGSGDISNSAAKLFIDSASRVSLNFDLRDIDNDQIVKICQLTEGHPLAIVLAASWFDVLSCAEIFQELSAGIGLLDSNIQDMPERHQSIHAAFTTSWQLLSESDQKIYMSLNVFRGGFDRKAAHEVAHASLANISSLFNRSLIEYKSELGRYEFHNLIHQFLLEKTELVLATEQREKLCNRHATYIFKALETWEIEFQTNSVESLIAFERDFENVRAAWKWAVIHERFDLLDRGIDGLRLFCTLSGRYQALVQLIEPALRIIPENSDSLSTSDFEIKLLVSLGTAYISIGGFIAPEAKRSFERATHLSESLENTTGIFSTLNSLAAYYWCIVDFDTCLDIATQWRKRLVTFTEDPKHEQYKDYLADAEVAGHLVEGAVRYQRGEFTLAKNVLNLAISLYRPERHVEYITNYGQDPSVFCRYWLARCYWVLGKPDKAKAIAQEAVDIAHGFEHPFTKMFAHCAVLDIANFTKQHSEIKAAATLVSELASENNFAVFQAISVISNGLALCNVENEKTMREQGLAVMDQSYGIFNIQMVTKETYASHIAGAYVQEKLFDKALNLIDQTLEFADLTKSNCSTADLLRLKANVFMAQGLSERAEELFVRAIDTAVQQGARLLELRAATSYAIFLREEGRILEARESISSIYNTFDEGFATADLQSARTLLASLDTE